MSKNIETYVMACSDPSCNFKPMKLQRRPVGDYDVLIDMKYCGVCHSDLHTAANHLKGISPSKYPCVPGHELAGICTAVGPKVTKVKVGQKIGVGCMVDSCKKCSACKRGEEQMCSKQVGTYNGKDNGSGRAASPLGYTIGGYTEKMVVDEDFAIIIPDKYPLEYAGPVMCAGITMYDPMQRQGVKAGSCVGIVGLGGLGQMGIKIAKALGCEVTVISRSAKKEEFAKKCGADKFVVSTSEDDMQKAKRSLDLILNTIPVYHKYVEYNRLLKKKGGRQVLLGLHAGIAGAMITNMVTFNHSRVLHSGIGGIQATQDVINLCAEHSIYPDIKVVPVDELNSIYEKLDGNNDEGIRYVLDIANTLNENTELKYNAEAPKLGAFSGGISPFAAVREAAWLLFTGKWL
jgi:D-arabinose 1-dehydrogenase-like Zn-dependent alcohol dehydrogenase